MMPDDFETPPKVEGDQRTYYPNRPLAQTAANRGQIEYEAAGVYSAAAQFEPGRGFVAVLFSSKNIPAAWENGFEVVTRDITQTPTPEGWAAKKTKATTPVTGKTPTAPSSGATARVHAIAGKMADDGEISSRADRAKVMAACTEAGINPATAGTQWAKFAKLRGW